MNTVINNTVFQFYKTSYRIIKKCCYTNIPNFSEGTLLSFTWTTGGRKVHMEFG